VGYGQVERGPKESHCRADTLTGKVNPRFDCGRALLKFCEENKLHPVKYERALEEIKQKPEYQEIARGLDLEQSAEEIDLNELLQKMSSGNTQSFLPQHFCAPVV
jgi:hypothetical protein